MIQHAQEPARQTIVDRLAYVESEYASKLAALNEKLEFVAGRLTRLDDEVGTGPRSPLPSNYGVVVSEMTNTGLKR